MTNPNAAIGGSIALANPWTVVPALGMLDAYIVAANRLPRPRPHMTQPPHQQNNR